jgi:hypothetical protein
MGTFHEDIRALLCQSCGKSVLKESCREKYNRFRTQDMFSVNLVVFKKVKQKFFPPIVMSFHNLRTIGLILYWRSLFACFMQFIREH